MLLELEFKLYSVDKFILNAVDNNTNNMGSYFKCSVLFSNKYSQ